MGLAHRREDGAHDDRVPLGGGRRGPGGEAGEDGADDLVEGQAADEVQFGREADLGVDDAVAREVEGALAGDAFEVLARLHDGVVWAKPSR